jgi:DNA-binding NtrC family response regulator
MDNPVTQTQINQSARNSDRAASFSSQGETSGNGARQLETLRIAVGTNLADVERWMIFATLQKCGGNKTRAAALLGVSLKTLYNRLNAYRTQGLAMDYELPGSDGHEDPGRDDHDAVKITTLHGQLTEVPL